MMIAERQVLKLGTSLSLDGKKCMILGVMGTGTSCIAYKAQMKLTIKGQTALRTIVLKELYPAHQNIIRGTDNSLIIPGSSKSMFEEESESFVKAAILQFEFHNEEDLTNFTSDIEVVYELNNTLYSVTGIVSGKSYDKINPENITSILKVGESLSHAISYYHEGDYLNLDIKPSNIFYENLPGDNVSIRLFDFNTVCTKEEASQGKFSYSEGYAAPEVRAAKKGSGKFSEVREQADIYSIGAVIFEKIMGRIPKASDQRAGKRWKFENNPYLKDAVPQLQKGIIDLFRKTLAIDKNDRYSSAKELISDLEKLIKLAGIEVFLKNQRISPCTPKDIYISRKDILSKISKALDEKHILYLHALGGSGKSETAREYAEQCTDKYDFIQSVFYSDSLKKTIANLDFVGLEDKDRFAYTDEDIDRLYKYKYGLLGNKDLYGTNTLLIIDNYNPTSDEVIQNQEIISKLRDLHIHILFTTRVKPTDISECFDLENMFPEELRVLFFKINPTNKDKSERIKLVDEIIKLSYNHTMTVKLVAMQSAEYMKPLEEYRDVLQEKGLNSEFESEIINEKDGRLVVEDSVYNHIRALFKLNDLKPKQKYIMVNACLLPLSGLEASTFSQYIDLAHFESSSGSDFLDPEIKKLVNSGWIEFANKNEKRFTSETKITLHPLVCDIVKNELKPEMTEDKCKKFYESFLDLIDEWGNRKADEEDCIRQENMVYELFPNIYAIYENRNIPAVINFIALSDIKISVRNHIMISDGKIILYFGNEKQLEIPADVTEIGNDAFSDSSLAEVNMPDSVKKIGDGAFSFCSALTEITIPNSITKIGKGIFSHCSELTHITIPNSVTEIGDYAFASCYNLMYITIPDSITKIGNYAFSCCYSLTEITIPNSVTKIGNGAFSDCWDLTNIDIPDSVTEIGEGIIDGCSLLDYQEFSKKGSTSQKLKYRGNKQLIELVIPNDITEIEDNAFEDCEALEKIMIPDSVTEIGNYAFRYCYHLKQITIPDSVRKIGEKAFEACFPLTEIHIPHSVTEIKTATFLNCLELKDITIPDSVTKIRSSAFAGCCSLTHIIIPDSVTEIESGAFSDCFSLTDIIIPDSVTKIRSSAFDGCRSLTEITIPNSVTEIESGVFAGCSSLTQIIIPDSVMKIGEKAFADCNNLSCVVVMNPTLDLSESMIEYYFDKNGLCRKKDELILKGYKNSTTDQYAQKHSVLFVSLD